jgi:hypothetical protein
MTTKNTTVLQLLLLLVKLISVSTVYAKFGWEIKCTYLRKPRSTVYCIHVNESTHFLCYSDMHDMTHIACCLCACVCHVVYLRKRWSTKFNLQLCTYVNAANFAPSRALILLSFFYCRTVVKHPSVMPRDHYEIMCAFIPAFLPAANWFTDGLVRTASADYVRHLYYWNSLALVLGGGLNC